MAANGKAPDQPDRRRTCRLEGREVIPLHGGYRNLKTFQLAEAIYDVTVRFCDLYLDPRSRTVDQMVQAARSGRQNIAEGSMDSATSRKIEMKLTGVAKGSLEELRLDYEDYLRQRGLPKWEPDHPALTRFKRRRCASLDDFRRWVAEEVEREREAPQAAQERKKEHGRTQTGTDGHGTEEKKVGPREKAAARRRVPAEIPARVSPCPSVFVANGALSLLNLCIYLLDRQLSAQARAFEQEGGFTERLYRHRKLARGG